MRKKEKTVNKCVRIPKNLWELYSSVLKAEKIRLSTDIRKMIMLRILISEVKPSVKFSILNKIEKEREK